MSFANIETHKSLKDKSPGSCTCVFRRLLGIASHAAMFFLMHCSWAQAPLGALSAEAEKDAESKQKADSQLKSSPVLDNKKLSSDPYSGIVVNQTITVAGQDFFQYFIAAWRDKDMTDKYEISINERPSARLGSQIWINSGQRRVYQTLLPAARAAIKPISWSAADAVYDAVVTADIQNLLFKDVDLAPDEF